MISSSRAADVLRIAASACAIYTIVTHSAYWISLVRIDSYWFVLVPTNSHRVRIASHLTRIDFRHHRTALSCILSHPFSSGSEMLLRGKSIRSWCDGSSDRSFMVDPLSYFSFQPVLHDWCNKGRGVCYPVYGIMHIKVPLLLIVKSSPCGGS